MKNCLPWPLCIIKLFSQASKLKNKKVDFWWNYFINTFWSTFLLLSLEACKKKLLCKVIMANNISLKNFFVYFIKIIVYLVKNICFLIFSQGATRNFLILPILETSDILFSYPIGILSGPQKIEMFFLFDQCEFCANALRAFPRTS